MEWNGNSMDIKNKSLKRLNSFELNDSQKAKIAVSKVNTV